MLFMLHILQVFDAGINQQGADIFRVIVVKV